MAKLHELRPLALGQRLALRLPAVLKLDVNLAFFPLCVNFRAHEFHYSKIINVPKDSKFLYDLKIGEGISSHKDALTEYNTVASYCHLYFDSAKFASNLIKNTFEI